MNVKTNLVELPSATTAVFILIVVMSLALISPIGDTFSCMLVLLILCVLFASLRLFLTAPTRWIAQNNMYPLEELDPELTKRMNLYAEEIHLRQIPTLLYTEAYNIPIQAFGTFRHHYIVINQAELNAARELKATEDLETMTVHELAHIKNGDVWKLQFSQQILRVYLVFSLIMVFSGPALLYNKWVTGNPAELAGDIVGLAIYPILLSIVFYLLRIMQNIREHYADSMAERFRGKGSIFSAWSALINIRNHIDYSKESSRTHILRRLAPGFLFPNIGNVYNNRLEALKKGASFHKSMRHVLFAGGLAVGLTVFSLSGGGIFWIYIGAIIGGLYLVITYLLPYISSGNHSFWQVIKQAIFAVFIFLGGMVTMFALYGFMFYISSVMVKKHPSVVTKEIKAILELSIYVLTSIGIMLAVFLFIAIPILLLLSRAIASDQLSGPWNIQMILIPVSLPIAVIAIFFGTANILLSFLDGVGVENIISSWPYFFLICSVTFQIVLLAAIALLSRSRKSQVTNE